MFRSIIFIGALLALSSAAMGADDEIVVTGHEKKTSPTVLRTNPVIPRSATDALKEGWVHAVLALSAAGDVTDIKIVESYPKGIFDDAVLGVATTWKFQPRMENGVAVADPAFDIGIAFYADFYESGRNTTEPVERGGSVRGINNANFSVFRHVLSALDSGNLKVAGENLDDLKKRYEAGDMSVTDIARYFAFRTRFDRLSGHFDVALEEARRTLKLAQFLDNGNVVYGIHLELLASLAALRRDDEAVDYFDSWSRVTKIPIPKEIVAYVESLRAAGAGKGHAYSIVDFDETHRRETRNKHDTRRVQAEAGNGYKIGSADVGVASLSTDLEPLCLDLPGEFIGQCP